MEIGHFIDGMINGTIERRQSPNVDNLLSEDTLQKLYDMKKLGDFTYIWKQESAITRSIIQKARDSDGRSYRLNDTIIIKFNGDELNFILSNTDLLKRIEPFFIAKNGKIPRTLEPIKI